MRCRTFLWLAACATLAPAILATPCFGAEPDLSACRDQVVFESLREGNWELIRANADGSEAVNLTQTLDLDELYTHVSADGRRICFVVDEAREGVRSRSVWYMNADGTGRTKEEGAEQ